MIQVLIALLLLFSASAAQAAETWSYDWETSFPEDSNTTHGIGTVHGCFRTASGDLWDSMKWSTKYKRDGTKSGRFESWSSYKNSDGKYGQAGNCPSSWRTEGKHRLEPKFAALGLSSSDPDFGKFQIYRLGQERWFRYSFFFPTDENSSIPEWQTTTDSNYKKSGIMIMQLFANPDQQAPGANDASHEVAFIFRGGSSTLWIQTMYSAADLPGGIQDEKTEDWTGIPVKLNAWNDVVFMHKADYDNDGRLKVWLNCQDWDNCTPVVNYSGPTAHERFQRRWWKGGLYEQYFPAYDRRLVTYIDSHMMGIRQSETEAQMLDYMSQLYQGTPPGGITCPPDCPSSPSTLVVNSNNAITSAQNPINFTVSPAVTNVTQCQMNGGDMLPTKFNHTSKVAGSFKGVSTAGFSASGTVACYDETQSMLRVDDDISGKDFGNLGTTTTDVAVTGVDHWGYTEGREIEKVNVATNADVYWTGGAGAMAIDDKFSYSITYQCLPANCDNIYFDIGRASGDDKRIRYSGTAGALVQGTIGAGLHGKDHTTTNYTLGDDTYRLVATFTATEADTNLKLRAGWKNSVAVGSKMTLLEIVERKNPTMTKLTDPVTYAGVVDTTPPAVTGCTLGLTPDGTGAYNGNISCAATEPGGREYVLLKTSSAQPTTADVKAGTGGVWSTSQVAEGATADFEAKGISFRSYWAWVVRCDAANNCNTPPASATFSAQAKRVRFSNSATRLRTADGVAYTGQLDFFLLTATDPRLPGAKSDLVFIDNPSITGGVINFSEADTVCETCVGSINTLPAGTYWFSTRDLAGAVKSVNTIQVIAE